MRVELGARSYGIAMGPLADLGAAVAPHGTRAVLVTNPVVGGFHAESAQRSLVAAGLTVQRLQIPDGEAHKTVATWAQLVRSLVGLGVDRQTVVVALGGGVTGDVAGFAAATTLRGLPVFQVPTSLLAMVDSSVGGKTGVNLDAGKNLVGAFHQPCGVFIPLDTLSTLPQEELRCGLGEVLKHAVLDADFFAWLEENAERLLARDPEALREAVLRSCTIKAAIVAEDELESGRRALLNAGHTLGHAFEKVLGFGYLRHGEAVAVGLVGEAWIAVGRGEAGRDWPARLAGLALRLGLPVTCPADPARVVAATWTDKKRSHGKLIVAYPAKAGEVRLNAVDAAELLTAASAVQAPLEV